MELTLGECFMEQVTYSNMNMRTSKDMMDRIVETPIQPKRIICLVPSLTELLSDLELEDNVIGITKFCIKPTLWFNSKTRIGGTKNVDFEKIAKINPDLIIANKEENTKEDIEKLAKLYSVWISDINNYEEAIFAIKEISIICNRAAKGNLLINNIEENKKLYISNHSNLKSVIYLIWKKPYMAVGSKTYIDNILELLGYTNCFKEERYKEITIEQIKELNPDYIFLSSEPYPFKDKDIKEIQKQIPSSICKLVDGELMSWYGSRLLYTFSESIFID